MNYLSESFLYAENTQARRLSTYNSYKDPTQHRETLAENIRAECSRPETFRISHDLPFQNRLYPKSKKPRVRWQRAALFQF